MEAITMSCNCSKMTLLALLLIDIVISLIMGA
jgi:hypothetical protein